MAGNGDQADVLRVLEFYSGVGGMHFAAKASGFATTVVSAFDINTLANSVYQHNFCKTPVSSRNIESLSAEELDAFKADAFLMSPPCQPYTRQGLQAGSTDPRSQSFLALLDALPKLKHPPRFLLIENVKGFDTSETRDETIRILESCAYNVEEYLLSPIQCGVPNSRLRYYLLASRNVTSDSSNSCDAPRRAAWPPVHTIRSELPPLRSVPMTSPLLREAWLSTAGNGAAQSGGDPGASHTPPAISTAAAATTSSIPTPVSTKADCARRGTLQDGSTAACASPSSPDEPDAKRPCQAEQSCSRGAAMKNTATSGSASSWCECGSQFAPEAPVLARVRSVQDFLEHGMAEGEIKKLLLPDSTLSQYRKVLDVVSPSCNHSCCFTKNYGRYLRGTGSVLNCARPVSVSPVDSNSTSPRPHQAEENLRYFSPQEVSNLMCFPASFAFPDEVTTKQRYRCLGNSLNVLVVAWLLQYLFDGSLVAA
ncbi:tRNA (cytosine(38)-C(5))-methyltransferase-like [Sycon ciliatum]|uniref:tRNA (cytosine(38)-C(5))-methyltransferase-like n=1 Tax=Sycon ciliatum TaxID=27933 RepID=UPI0031F6B6BA